MAKRIFTNQNWTPAANADTTALTGPYMAIQGGSTTQLINVLEFMISGFAAASAIALLTFARCTTGPTGVTALAAPASDGPMHPSTAALAAAPITFTTTSTTNPSRSAATTDAKINLGLNTFGGILKYNAGPGQEFSILGSTQPLGIAVLSAFTGSSSGAISADIIYEPL
jgi:hypothetical protein